MKRLLLASAVCLALLSAPAAFAAPGHGHGHGNSDMHGNGHWDNDDGDRGGGGHWDQGDRDGDGPRWHHDNGRHLGHYKHFVRGERVPVIYLEPRYVIRDYRVLRLPPPPPGFRWVRPEDGHYLLVATATGIISQILGY